MHNTNLLFSLIMVIPPGLFGMTPVPALKDVYAQHFLLGGAIGTKVLESQDPALAEVLLKHYNSATSENSLKWAKVHPELDRYNFEPADRYVDFCQRHDLFTVGHVLVWHQQTPGWVHSGSDGLPVPRDALVERLQRHIKTVVSRYKGRVHGWDVVNEALAENGSLRRSFWLEIIGEEYLEIAFRAAHAADPEAELYYNDYNMAQPAKAAGAVRMLKELLDKGVPVHGVGLQGHWSLDYPRLDNLRKSIEAYRDLGLKVMITELDVSVLPNANKHTGAEITDIAGYSGELDPYTGGLPGHASRALAARYRDLFGLFLDYRDTIARVTFWGLNDGDSWKNNFPVRGRTDYPLLFDRSNRPKEAFYSVYEAAGR